MFQRTLRRWGRTGAVLVLLAATASTSNSAEESGQIHGQQYASWLVSGLETRAASSDTRMKYSTPRWIGEAEFEPLFGQSRA